MCVQQGRVYIEQAFEDVKVPFLLRDRYAVVGEPDVDTALLRTPVVEIKKVLTM